VAAVLMALVALVLAAIVVLGMATGYRLNFDRGTAMASVRNVQIALGVVSLIGCASVISAVRGFYLGRSVWTVPAFVVTVLISVVWAFFRVVQYSS
jgi:hypothetical protein